MAKQKKQDLSREVFLQQVDAELRSRGAALQFKRDGSAFDLHMGFRVLDLRPLYHAAANDPRGSRRIIANAFSQFDEVLKAEQEACPEDPLRLVLPRIYSRGDLQLLDLERIPHREFGNGTVVVLVRRLQMFTVTVTRTDINCWGLSMEEVYDAAIQNLADYTGDMKVQFVDSKEGGKAAIMEHHDGFDAARLLLPDLHQRLAPTMKGDFLVGIPSRDTCWAISMTPPNFVERMKGLLARDSRNLPYPISPNLFVVTRDGVAGTVETAHDEVI